MNSSSDPRSVPKVSSDCHKPISRRTVPRLLNSVQSADALKKATRSSALFDWCFEDSAGESIRRDLEADIGRTNIGQKLVYSDI